MSHLTLFYNCAKLKYNGQQEGKSSGCPLLFSLSERNKITSAVMLVFFPSKKHKKVVP